MAKKNKAKNRKNRPGKTKMDAFVCYGSRDVEFAKFLSSELRDAGLKVQGEQCRLTVWPWVARMLKRDRFGVVVVSPGVLGKIDSNFDVPDSAELVLIRSGVSLEDLDRYPSLAGCTSLDKDMGAPAIARIIQSKLKGCAGMGTKSPVFGHVPGLPLYFAGRDRDLQALLQRFEVSGDGVSRVLLKGAPGIGKTMLVAAFVQKQVDSGRYPGGIFWVNGSAGPFSGLVFQWAGPVAEALDIEVSHDIPAARAHVFEYIKAMKCSALIVLDNIGPSDAQDLAGALPLADHVDVLVTADDPDMGLPGFDVFTVGPLDKAASRAVLMHATDREDFDQDGLDRLAGYLEGHVFSLVLAGTYLRENADVTMAGYVDSLAAKALDGYGAKVRQVLKDLYTDLAPGLQDAWHVLSLFDFAFVRTGLLKKCGIHEDADSLLDFNVLARSDQGYLAMHPMASNFVPGPEEKQKILVDIKERCLEGMDEDKIRIMDLGHLARAGMLYVQEAMETKGLDLLDAGLLLVKLGNLLEKYGLVQQAHVYFMKALELYEKLVAARPSDGEARFGLALTFRKTGLIYANTGEREKAEKLLKKAIDILEDLVKEDPDNTDYLGGLGAAYHALAGLFTNKGGTDIVDAIQSLDIEDFLSMDAIETDPALYYLALGNLASGVEGLFEGSKEFRSPADMLRQSIEISRAMVTHGRDHVTVKKVIVKALNKAGVAHTIMDREMARPFLARAMERAEELALEYPKDMEIKYLLGLSCSNLGGVLKDRKYLERAINILEKGIDLAPKDPQLKDAMVDARRELGDLFAEQGYPGMALGEYAKLEKMLEDMVSTGNATLNNERELAELLVDMGGQYLEMDEEERAMGLFASAIKMAGHIQEQGGDSRRTRNLLSRFYVRIGNLLADKGKFEQAVEYFLQEIQIRWAKINQEDMELSDVDGLVESYERLSDAFRAMGKVEDAAKYAVMAIQSLELMVERFEAVLERNDLHDHMDADEEDTDEAFEEGDDEPALQKAEAIFRKMIGGKHPKSMLNQVKGRLAAQCGNLAELVAETGDYSAPKTYYEKAVDILVDMFDAVSEDDDEGMDELLEDFGEDLLKYTAELSDVLFEQGDFQGIVDVYGRSMDALGDLFFRVDALLSIWKHMDFPGGHSTLAWQVVLAARFYQEMGMALLKAKRMDDALEKLNESVRLARFLTRGGGGG